MIRGRAGLRVGKGSSVDRTAIVGYRPARQVKDLSLEIGAGAKIRAGTIVYLGSRIGKEFETGHGVVVREEVTIGDRCRIWNATTIDYGVRIGDRVKIHCNGYIAQYTIIEDDVFIAPGLVVANDRYPESRDLVGPIIEKAAKIGCNVTLLPGVRIGRGALIGAGSVVVRDVPAGAVAVGNPSRVIKRVQEIPAYLARR